ncbi:MAG: hypothetical protein AMXMBFR82_07160 [Candidatus Hydrogenedentota bacterium]
MKSCFRLQSIGVLALAFSFGVFSLLELEAHAEAIVHVLEPNVEIEEWPLEISFEHQFVVENRGDEDLVLEVGSKSCGCITSFLTLEHISPGAVGKVGIRTDNRSVANRPYLESMTVVLETNDPDHPTITLSARANIVPVAYVVEKTVNLGELEVGSIGTGKFLLRHRVPMEIVDIENSSPALTVSNVRSFPDGEWRIKEFSVEFMQPEVAAWVSETTMLTTDNVLIPVIEVDIESKSKYVLRADPGVVSFGGVLLGDSALRTVILNSEDEGISEPDHLALDNPDIEGKIVKSNARSEYELEILVHPTSLCGVRRGFVRVYSSDAQLLSLVGYIYSCPRRLNLEAK